MEHFNEYGFEHAFKLCKKLFTKLIWRGKIYDNPCTLIQITSYPSGFCHSINLFPPKSMYTKTYLDSYVLGTAPSIVDQNPYNFKDSYTSWTPDNGYTNIMNSNNDEAEIPFRVTTGSFMNSLNLLLEFGNNDLQEYCRPRTNGFVIYIHSPMEWPFTEQPMLYDYVDVDKLTVVFVETRFTKTDDSLRDWSPEERGCYYTHERQLMFFKYYSLNNCNLECDANITLQMCNCNMFFQPRLFHTPICGLDKVSCFIESEMVSTDPSRRKTSHLNACNCLPSCNELAYEVNSISQPRNWTHNSEYYFIPGSLYKIKNIGNIFVGHKMRSYNSFIRTAISLPTDFVANIGGLLGLFLGFSCISVFEIVYFIVFRWITDLWNKNNRLRRESESKNIDEENIVVRRPIYHSNIDSSRVSFPLIKLNHMNIYSNTNYTYSGADYLPVVN